MFGKCGKKTDKVNPAITVPDLMRQMGELEAEIESLKAQNNNYVEQLRGQVSKATFSVNWELLQAFSIERMMVNGVVKTVIGYFDHTQPNTASAVREWTLYCSPEEHERLVKDFDRYIIRYKKRIEDEQLQDSRS